MAKAILLLICQLLLFCNLSSAADAGQIGHTTEDVNLRQGPSLSATRIGRLKAGTEVEVINRDHPGWYFVLYRRQPGFVRETYVRIEQSRKSPESKQVLGIRGGLETKEMVVGIAIAVFLVMFLIVRRYVSFPRLTTVLFACGGSILLFDTAFKLGILYSVLLVSFGLFLLNAFLSRPKPMPPPGYVPPSARA